MERVMEPRIDDLRIKQTRPLIQPAILTEEIVRLPHHSDRVLAAREAIANVIAGQDNRLLCIVGPCSIHDVESGLAYAQELVRLHDKFSDDLLIVMRAYFEKPRTVGGWKGLINDPDLDGSHKINKGLRLARTFLRDVVELGLPAATEFLDTTVPQHISDFISWGAIGARTVESQTHRELASGLSMPIGFKNATDGRVQPAIDGVLAAARSHWFPSTTKDGVAALSQTTGNESCHIILRGGESGPNFGADSINTACQKLAVAGLRPSVMVDCSHGNSLKDHTRQAVVAETLAGQLQSQKSQILGIMLESNLVAGKQEVEEGAPLAFGQSITDSCIDLRETELILEKLAMAVHATV